MKSRAKVTKIFEVSSNRLQVREQEIPSMLVGRWDQNMFYFRKAPVNIHFQLFFSSYNFTHIFSFKL